MKEPKTLLTMGSFMFDVASPSTFCPRGCHSFRHYDASVTRCCHHGPFKRAEAAAWHAKSEQRSEQWQKRPKFPRLKSTAPTILPQALGRRFGNLFHLAQVGHQRRVELPQQGSREARESKARL